MAPPPPRFDSHVHIWHPPDSAAFPPAPDRPPPPVSPAGTPADLAAALTGAGVAGAAIVQPINYGFDHTAVAAAVAGAAATGVRLAGVALAATPGGPDAAAAALRSAVGGGGGAPAMAGVRLNPALLPAGEGLDGPTAAAVVATAGTLGVPVNVFARPPDLVGLAALAAGHPSVGVWVDHWAFCRPVGGEAHWERLLALGAAAPRVGLKLSAPFRVSNVGAPYGDLAAWATQAVGVFGAGRLMWGSDWPYVEEAGGYAAAWAAADTVLAGVGEENRARILGGTAAAVYGL